MANQRLKKIILEVVDNQLRDNDPPCTTWAYEQLVKAGCSKAEAKEKLGAIVVEEIYDVLKNGDPFDEQQYEAAIRNMVQQYIDFEDDNRLPSEWDEIGTLISKGYRHAQKRQYPAMTDAWMKAWEMTRANAAQAEYKIGICGLDEATDYEYSFEGWLQDMEVELLNAGQHKKRLQFCRDILEALDWEYDDYGGFKMAVGESLCALGKQEEGMQWFETWLKEEPHNVDAVNGYAISFLTNGETEKAFCLVEKELKNQKCTLDNEILFLRAAELAGLMGEEEKQSGYQKAYQVFMEQAKDMTRFEDIMFGDYNTFSEETIIKPEKIYPNDSCPCGSGKKYKKCCRKSL